MPPKHLRYPHHTTVGRRVRQLRASTEDDLFKRVDQLSRGI